jgi:hypothetical protein
MSLFAVAVLIATVLFADRLGPADEDRPAIADGAEAGQPPTG